MRKFCRSNPAFWGYLFSGTLLTTVGVYVLRGIGRLTFIPGGVLLGLIFLSLLTGLFYWWERRRRF